jgi:hypothetical protein
VGKIRIPVEVQFSVALVLVMLAVSVFFHLPIRMPNSRGANFVGIHYIYPLCVLMIGAFLSALAGRWAMIRQVLVALPCYITVLVVHFHLKLWTPLINPHRYDDLYWAIDGLLRPLVDICFRMRTMMLPVVPYESNFYMLGFIALFWLSLGYHALCTPRVFRTLFLAMLFMQGLGAIFYLVFPAIGPFLYEPGLNPYITESQRYMLGVHDVIVRGGPAWLSVNESAVLLAGLGAMPSLHVGCSYLFLCFAGRYGRPLLPLYIPLFGYIVINAVASRWHYLVDLPAGILLAHVSIALAHRFAPPEPALAQPAALRPGWLPDVVEHLPDTEPL